MAAPKTKRRRGPARLSVRAFAKSVGVSHTAIQAGIRNGRLDKSIGHDARKRPYVRDSALAIREWTAGAGKVAPRAGPSLVEAQVRVAGHRAVALELSNRIKSGEVHHVDSCEREHFEMARMLRDRILGVPDRLADLGPVVRARLRAELRQALGDHAAEVERG